jgi:hypothetical protein
MDSEEKDGTHFVSRGLISLRDDASIYLSNNLCHSL